MEAKVAKMPIASFFLLGTQNMKMFLFIINPLFVSISKIECDSINIYLKQEPARPDVGLTILNGWVGSTSCDCGWLYSDINCMYQRHIIERDRRIIKSAMKFCVLCDRWILQIKFVQDCSPDCTCIPWNFVTPMSYNLQFFYPIPSNLLYYQALDFDHNHSFQIKLTF